MERAPSTGYLSLQHSTGFPELANDRILKAARGEPVDQLPVWIMRQAGRYLPEFWTIREKHDFFSMCTTPDVACEVTLQPIERFPLDAAIIFSDILVVPQAMGMQVDMVPGKGPVFPNPLASQEDVDTLKKPDLATDYEAYFNAIHKTRVTLAGRVPLFGFAGGPFTLFAYMVEGEGSKTFGKTKKWLFQNPESAHFVLKMLADVVSEFLLGQICSGAQIIQVFESHAGILGPDDFNTFLLPYIKQIAAFLKQKATANPELAVPMVIFAKDAHYALPDLFASDFDIVQLDWTADLEKAKALSLEHGKTIQGNLDPYLLFSPDEELVRRTKEMIDKIGKSRYIVNLGHGIDPSTDPNKVKLFIDTIHEYSASLVQIN